MDAKKTIMQFIKPRVFPVIVLLVFPPLTFVGLIILLCITIPGFSRAKKNIHKLEMEGNLDKAAEEIMSINAKRLVNGKVILTDNYIFGKRNGNVIAYDEVMWVYKHRYTKRVLFIPVRTIDSLYLATKTKGPKAIASMGKDKMDEIQNAIWEIKNHNNNCLIGYSNELATQYREMLK